MLLLTSALSQNPIRQVLLAFRVENFLIKKLPFLSATLFLGRRTFLRFPISRQDVTKDQFSLVLEVRFLGIPLSAPVFPRVTLHVLAILEGLLNVREDFKGVRIFIRKA